MGGNELRRQKAKTRGNAQGNKGQKCLRVNSELRKWKKLMKRKGVHRQGWQR